MAIFVVATCPAHAAPPAPVVQEAGGISYSQASIFLDSLSQGSQKAKCPKKTTVTGGGVYITGTSVDIEVASTAPYDGLDKDKTPDDGWMAEGNADGSQRTMTVYAVCAKPKHFYYRQKEFKGETGFRTGKLATCDVEDRAIGGGILTTTSSTQIAVGETSSYFNGTRDGWLGAFNNQTGKTRKATVYVICRGGKDKTTGSSATQPAPVGQQLFETPCFEPPGKTAHVLGGGGAIDGGLLGEIATTYPIDDADADTVPDNGWAIYTNNETGADVQVAISNRCLLG